jgi:acyl-homoserine lactone acylase PvdQ
LFITEKTGEIAYFQGGGNLPIRGNNVASGVYPKLGWKPQNKWQGRIPHDDMPYMINPKSGYIASSNNFMTSENVKHGISYAFTYTGRKTVISELIEQAFERTGNKVTAEDMKDIQTNVLDVQARASTRDMLYCVEKATIQLSDIQRAKVATAVQIFADWDYHFTSDSAAASVFMAWEIMLSYYLHEKKITSPVNRVSLSYGCPLNQFTWLSIQEWAANMREYGKSTHAEYCAVNEIAGDDCLNFMMYTLVKAVEDVEARLGPYDAAKNNWRYGNLAKVRIEH